MEDAVLKALLRGLDLCVIECRSFAGTAPKVSDLSLLTPTPGWLAGPLSGLPFLEHFLAQADATWHEGAQATSVSDPFVTNSFNEEVLMRATAISQDGHRLIIIQRLTGPSDVRPMLQTAREQKLALEQLGHQASAVHGPAAAIDRDLKVLSDAGLPPEHQQVLQRLLQSSAQLQAAAAPLPLPAKQRRQAKG